MVVGFANVALKRCKNHVSRMRRFLTQINTAMQVEVKVYFLRILSAMILVAAAKMPQKMPMKKALTGS